MRENRIEKISEFFLTYYFFSDSSFFLRVDLMQSSGKNKE